jgi:hypothetical protein
MIPVMSSSQKNHRFTHHAAPRAVAYGVGYQLSLSLLIVIVISFLLLGQEDLEVGTAP